MEQVSQAITSLLALFRAGFDWVLAMMTAVEVWLAGRLTAVGAPPSVQTPIMIAIAILLLLLVIRVFGGIIRISLVIFLILLALHALLPLAHA